MNQIQKTALEFWLSGVEFENDFKPNSDQQTSDYLKSIGHNFSKSAIFKWRRKFRWDKELDFRIKQLTSEDEKIRASLGDIAKDETITKTIVDLERNKVLLGKGYEVLEFKLDMVIQKYKTTQKLSNDDTKIVLAITQLMANREDRMMDRKVISETLGKEDAFKAIAQVAKGIEFDGEPIDDKSLQSADIIEAQFEDMEE